MALKILFFSQYFYPEQFSNNDIATELVDRGHEVDVVCCVPNYPEGHFFKGYSNHDRRQDLWGSVRIHRARTYARGRSSTSLMANYAVYPLSALWTALRRVKHIPDVSFVSIPSPLLQAFAGVFYRWLKGVPVVYWVQDIWPETVQYLFNIKDGPPLQILDAICGWLYRRADIVMVQSAAMVPLIERHGIDKRKIQVLPNTAPEMYRPEKPESFPQIRQLMPQSGFNIMFAGNIGESQGLETLVAAVDMLRHRSDIHFTIIGSGGAMEAVQTSIARRNLEKHFTFLGRFPPDQMPGFFAQADAMFVSLKDFPNFALTVPYKVQCYLACGRPIIASISGEGARIIKAAGAGFTSPAEDVE